MRLWELFSDIDKKSLDKPAVKPVVESRKALALKSPLIKPSKK